MNTDWAKVKPFAKTAQKIATVTIDENGDILFLATDSNDIFLEDTQTITKRASHVEPAPRYERWLFHFLRAIFGDKGRVSDWTRQWNTLWRIDTSPVGGPILRDADGDIRYWFNRQAAIDAEIAFLNDWFLERGI